MCGLKFFITAKAMTFGSGRPTSRAGFMKGGKRSGAGRPPAPPNVLVRLRLSPAQHAAYVERGAEHWLKRVLGEAVKNALKP